MRFYNNPFFSIVYNAKKVIRGFKVSPYEVEQGNQFYTTILATSRLKYLDVCNTAHFRDRHFMVKSSHLINSVRIPTNEGIYYPLRVTGTRMLHVNRSSNLNNIKQFHLPYLCSINSEI